MWRGLAVFQERFISPHDAVDVPDVDDPVAPDPGHLLVRLGRDDRSLLGGGQDGVDAYPEA